MHISFLGSSVFVFCMLHVAWRELVCQNRIVLMIVNAYLNLTDQIKSDC